MGDKTGIEWASATWNPIVGCSVVSPGCTNCYAMKMAARIERMLPDREIRGVSDSLPNRYVGLTQPSKAGAVWTGKIALAPDDVLTQPLRWSKPRAIFVNSMGDLFHEAVPDAWIDRVFAVMALAPQHTFIVLTKRAKRMREYFAGCSAVATGRNHTSWRQSEVRHAIAEVATLAEAWDRTGNVKVLPLPNLVLGVSAEDQTRADERIPELLATPAAKRIVSAEPLLGPIDLYGAADLRWNFIDRKWNPRSGVRLDGIIVGGESGSGARPMHPAWARSIRDQCEAAGVRYFFKQWGSWAPSSLGAEVTRKSAEERRLVNGEWSGTMSILNAQEPDTMNRVDKKAAGRLLDGREHNDLPWSVAK